MLLAGSLAATALSGAGMVLYAPGASAMAQDLLQLLAVVSTFVTICMAEARLAS